MMRLLSILFRAPIPMSTNERMRLVLARDPLPLPKGYPPAKERARLFVVLKKRRKRVANG